MTNQAKNQVELERRDRLVLRNLIEHPIAYVCWTALGLAVAIWAQNAMAILGWLAATGGALHLASRDGYGVRVLLGRGIARLSLPRRDLTRH
jgi:hypothetical protein